MLSNPISVATLNYIRAIAMKQRKKNVLHIIEEFSLH